MAKKDYYETLGISKSATKDDIKRAYRKLAHQYHPDKQGGNEAKFKEANEAYQILGDEQKKAQYDRFGTGFNDNAGGSGGGRGFGGFSAGGDQGFEFDFGGFEDIFDIFGGGFGRGAKAKSRSRKGQDIKIDFLINLEDSAFGTETEVNFKKLSSCEKCGGKGGFEADACARCGGSGQVQENFKSIFGTMAQIVVCPKCRGEGKSFKKICSQCEGEGRYRKTVDFKIKIPKGILDGDILRFPGDGQAGQNGAPPGDLLVQINFKPHKYFQNKGVDVYYDTEIDMATAALGDKIEIPTLYGNVKLKIEPGAQPDDIIRISGKGLPKRGSWGGHGDMYVKIKVEVPKHLTSKQRELLEEFKKS